ncbi:MAG: hypothetical protein M1320_02660 [Patescibacteria group bacterium]|nr:hypothetical protein [Patescibacteria group bacterium]
MSYQKQHITKKQKSNQKERIRALFFFVPALTAETYGNSITELFKKSKYEAPQINT